MTLREAKTVERGTVVQVTATGEITNVLNSHLSPDGKTVEFELLNDYNDYMVLPHKELKIYHSIFQKSS